MQQKKSIYHTLFDTKKIFGVHKPIIAMLHLQALPGQPGFVSMQRILEEAKNDLKNLQDGGVNGILIENWREDSHISETKNETVNAMKEVIVLLKPFFHIPFGINVLNNDYKATFFLAKETHAAFVELDVFTDHVRSDFHYSAIGKDQPFEIYVDVNDVTEERKKYHMEKIPLLVFIQPKHYIMLDPDKRIEQSAQEAVFAGADGLIITKATGVAPERERIKKVKESIASVIPVGIGSGFSVDNARDFMKTADFVIVGSATKIDGNVDNPVDLSRVKQLMSAVRPFQF